MKTWPLMLKGAFNKFQFSKCERGKFVLGREERKNKKCSPGKSRKEETVEKMGPNGWPGNPGKGD